MYKPCASTRFVKLGVEMLTWEDTEALSHEPLADNKIIIRGNRAVVPFEPSKISTAMMKAFLAVRSTQGTNAVVAEPWQPSELFRHWARHLSRLNRLIQSAFTKRLIVKTPPVKVNGFFSSSKANLRNAP